MDKEFEEEIESLVFKIEISGMFFHFFVFKF